MSFFHIGEVLIWRNCHRNFAPAAQSAWPEYEHRVLVEEVRSVQAATTIVSRSQLDSHARSESLATRDYCEKCLRGGPFFG